MIPTAMDGLTTVRASAVALADETLSHFHILVSFMAAFGEAYASQRV